MLISPLILIGGCKSNTWTYNNVVLYSTEPEMKFIVDRGNSYMFGTITTNEEILDAQLSWGHGSFDIYIPGTNQNYGDAIYLNGRVRFYKNHADLTVHTDNVFDGKYKTIRIYRRAIEDGEVR